MKISRRNALAKLGAGAGITGTMGISGFTNFSEKEIKYTNLKGNINHSVCRWPYGDTSLNDLCKASVDMGIKSIEIVGPKDWPTLKEHGLTSAMPRDGDIGLTKGFSESQYHNQLVENFEKSIPRVAEAGFDKVICFSGNRNGMDDETGWKNCEKGLKRLLKTAENNNVTLVMELLNSKRDHPDYLCDHTKWGVELCNRLGSENFKLLYDIYHMQIMEGDVIQTIRDYNEYIAHYHTGGVPGRNELDESQELYYPAIMNAILETGYEGFVGQEFVPTWDDPLEALRHGVGVCDV